jgi:hypothetical protein
MLMVTACAVNRMGVLPHIIRKSRPGSVQKARGRLLHPKLMITACFPRGVVTAKVVFTRGSERARTRV